MIPGPIGTIAGVVSAVSYAATGNWREAAWAAAGSLAAVVGAGAAVKGARYALSATRAAARAMKFSRLRKAARAVRAAHARWRESARIASQKQAGHIRGTPQWKQRMKAGKLTSTWRHSHRWARWHTRLAWTFGRRTGGAGGERVLRFPWRVGRANGGGWQHSARTVCGKSGCHGTPWWP
jgi:hypothetical protein